MEGNDHFVDAVADLSTIVQVDAARSGADAARDGEKRSGADAARRRADQYCAVCDLDGRDGAAGRCAGGHTHVRGNSQVLDLQSVEDVKVPRRDGCAIVDGEDSIPSRLKRGRRGDEGYLMQVVWAACGHMCGSRERVDLDGRRSIDGAQGGVERRP